MPSGRCGPSTRPRRFCRSVSSKNPSGLEFLSQHPAHRGDELMIFYPGVETRIVSALARPSASTTLGSRSIVLHTSRRWSSPSAPASTAAPTRAVQRRWVWPDSERRGQIRRPPSSAGHLGSGDPQPVTQQITHLTPEGQAGVIGPSAVRRSARTPGTSTRGSAVPGLQPVGHLNPETRYPPHRSSTPAAAPTPHRSHPAPPAPVRAPPRAAGTRDRKP